jgi:hypothetical protein
MGGQYKLNAFYKRSSQLSKDIYKLPLDIKVFIFKMAMDTHMKEWRTKHRDTIRSWYGLKTRHRPFSCLDLIKGWGIQAPKNKFFPYIHDLETGHLRGSIPDEYKIKLCSDDNVSPMEDGMLLMRKIDTLYISNDTSSDPQYSELLHDREMEPYYECEKSKYRRLFWIHKKCRCLTCDLIRLKSLPEYGLNYRDHWGRRIDAVRNKYCHIDYLGNGQWKTYTESQIYPSVKEQKLLKQCKNV